MNRAAMGFTLLAVTLLAACGGGTTSSPELTATSTPLQPTPTFTPVELTPTPTPVPVIALVNGEAISLASYQAGLGSLQAALSVSTGAPTGAPTSAPTGAPTSAPSGTPTGTPSGTPTGTELATEDEQRVLDDLIDQVLLAQGAAEAGFSVDETMLQERIDKLVEGLGSRQALLDWMAENGYAEEGFRQDLGRAVAAAWMRDQVIAAAPDALEQVHARQILLNNSEEASQVLADLRSGKDFAGLAATYDPLTKGDLGWFPRGYLFDKNLEDAAFGLQAGEYSQVIETPSGFHILQVIERDPQRTLDPNARLVLQMQNLKDWLAERRSQSEIQVISP